MIPWTIGQQYQDTEFPRLSGARVVRIAAHPNMARAGYGTRALELLRRYYEGDLADLVLPRPLLTYPVDECAWLCACQTPKQRQHNPDTPQWRQSKACGRLFWPHGHIRADATTLSHVACVCWSLTANRS